MPRRSKPPIRSVSATNSIMSSRQAPRHAQLRQQGTFRLRENFGKAETMATWAAQLDEARKEKDAKMKEQFSSPPPVNEPLFQVTLVLSNQQAVLPEFKDLSIFDSIRVAEQVWIVQGESNTLRIYSREKQSLQNGFKAINSVIHHRTMDRTHTSSLFLVQTPCDNSLDHAVRVDLDQRPLTVPLPNNEQLVALELGSSDIADDLLGQIRPDFSSCMELLRIKEGSFQMRVDFGHVIIQRRKINLDNPMRFTDFKAMAFQYAWKRGAEFHAHFEQLDIPPKLFNSPRALGTNLINISRKVTYKRRLEFEFRDQKLVKEDSGFAGDPRISSSVHLTTPEPASLLNWVVFAPDRKYDWRLQVRHEDFATCVPKELDELINNVKMREIPLDISPRGFLDKTTDWDLRVPRSAFLTEKVVKTRLILSALIPFRDTPFVFEMSQVREWQGIETLDQPITSTTMGFYGAHWSDDLNFVKSLDMGRNWGLNHSNLWKGSAQSSEGQFSGFVCYILEILSALE